ncbi:MAG: amino acid ABC transporter permease [Dongiaceae bacterium]
MTIVAEFRQLLTGLPWTVALMAASFVVGALLGLPLMMARRSRFPPLRLAVVVLFAVVRAVPPLVWVFLVFFGIGFQLISMTPFVACLATFGVIAGINMAEIYRGGLLAIHFGQLEAAKALNLGRWHTFVDVVAPQMFRVALPSSATYAIGIFKESAIASTIGVQELTYQANYLAQTTFRGLEVFGMVGLVYILISLPIAWLSRTVDRRIRARVAR